MPTTPNVIYPLPENCIWATCDTAQTGKSGLSYVHPFLRRDNWRAKNLSLCGNFNLTNVDEIFAEITGQGQHPRQYADTYIMLEQIGHRLDREADKMYDRLKASGLDGIELTRAIEDHIDMANVLRRTSPMWDGGYVICGVTGQRRDVLDTRSVGIAAGLLVCRRRSGRRGLGTPRHTDRV